MAVTTTPNININTNTQSQSHTQIQSQSQSLSSPFSTAENNEISQIWAQVRIRVVQLAGGDPSALKSDLSVDDVLRYVEQAQARDKKAEEKYGAVKNVFDKTLKCIQTVGGIVASGANQVFGGSELAFNALTFVINAWQGYEGIFESLAGLLEKCVEFLDRMTYYVKAGMDFKLQRVACQHLQLFVEICDRTIKLRHSKLVKLKVFSKLFFLNDNDIQGLLDMMSGLVDKEGHLVAAQTFNFSSEAAANSREALLVGHRMDNKLDSLVEDKLDQKKEKDILKRRETILKTLAFDEEMMDKEKKEPKAPWRSTYNNYRNKLVPGSGEWITTEPRFVAWEAGNADSPPILLVQGGEGSGKSYLTTAVVKHLQSHSPLDVSGSRTSVAFYYLEGRNKEGTKTLNSLDMVSKSVVWQFSQGDVSYQKSVAGICEKFPELDHTEIWSWLLFDNKDRDKIDTTFFIVIDGLGESIDQHFMDLFRKVSSAHGDRRIRMFLTGSPASVEELENDISISFQKLELAGNNSTDVNKYIDMRMDQMDALKDSKRTEISTLRENIRNRLRDETKGDYFKLDTNLSKIADLDSVNDINEVLENAGKERSDQIIGEIEKLNKTRNPREIQEINLLILWILYSKQWFVPSQMDELLYLQNGEASLLSLESKVKTRYSIFVVDSDGDLDFKSSDIPGYIPVKSRLSENDIILARGDEIQPSEVAIVEHFLQTVCPPKLYSKFAFAKFFENHLQISTLDYIYKDDKDNAEMKCALICLRSLTEAPDDKTINVRLYAASLLPIHLGNVDLALVWRDSKSEIGKRLLKLLTDDDCIDGLFQLEESDYCTKRRETWLYDDDGANHVLRWFKDSAVVSEISDEDSKSWISSLLSGEATDDHLLKPAVKRAAFRWLRQPSSRYVVSNAFLLVLGIISKLKHQKDSKAVQLTGDPAFVSLEQISEAEIYAQHLLQITERDSLWELQMAITYERYTYSAETEERSRAALTLDPDNWRASHELANATNSNGEAIELLKGISGSFGDHAIWLQDADNKSTFATVLYDLGEKYWDDAQYEEAVKTWTRSIEQVADDQFRNFEILKKYKEGERWIDITTLIDVLRHDGSSNFRDMAENFASDEELHQVILETAAASANFDLLDSIYHEIIDHTTETESFDELYYTRFYYGKAMNYRPGKENDAIELWQRALREDLPRSELSKEDLLPALILALAPIYLRLVRAVEPNSDLAKDYLVRIGDWLHDDVIERNLTYSPKLFLARYYHLQGDDLRAKEAVRRAVKIALEMLADDDDSNDYDAYFRLLSVFIPMEDDENVYVTLRMCVASRQIPKKEDEIQAVEEVVEGDVKPANENLESNDALDEGNSGSAGTISTAVNGIAVAQNGQSSAEKEAEETSKEIEKSADTENGDSIANSIDTRVNAALNRIGDESILLEKVAIEAEVPEVEGNAGGLKDEDQKEEEADEGDAENGGAENRGAEEDEQEEEDGDEEESESEEEEEEEEEEESESEEEGEEEKDEQEGKADDSSTSDPIIAWCDGDCGQNWTKPRDMYCCRDCIAYQFESTCYAKLQNGTLKRRVCDKNHSFLYIVEVDAEDEDVNVTSAQNEVGKSGEASEATTADSAEPAKGAEEGENAVSDVAGESAPVNTDNGAKKNEKEKAKLKRGEVKVGNEVISVEEWKARIRKAYVDFAGHVEDFDLAEKE